MSNTLIILPTYNEADNLRPMTERLLAMKPALEVLVVDDNSPDGTGDIAAGLAKAMNNSATTAKPQQNKRAGANPGPSSGWLGWLGILLTNQLFAQRRP